MAWLFKGWPGRVLVYSAANFIRIEIFDRSMTIAAQFFTSVLPILIVLATWGSGTDEFGEALGMPEESQSVLEEAVQGTGAAAFGIVGLVIVLASATSLSRALTRAFAAIWVLPRPRSRLGSAWRWVAVVVVLALSLVVTPAASASLEGLPPREVWPLVASLPVDLGVAMFVPWVLLAGAVHPRLLVPGSVLFALLMLTVRPAAAAWLPRALEVSADRYGSIGVAFSYLTLLYIASFCFLGTAAVGQVIATDEGGIGRRIQGAR